MNPLTQPVVPPDKPQNGDPDDGWGIMMGRSTMLSMIRLPKTPSQQIGEWGPEKNEISAAQPEVKRLSPMARSTLSFRVSLSPCQGGTATSLSGAAG